MPQTQLSSRLGSDNSIFGLKETKKIGQSKFNFSKKNFSTVDIGPVTPVDWFFVYPNDKVKLSIRYLLDTHPLEVPPMNNYYVRTHWYYVKMSSLWKGWNTFITRGRSGNIDLEIPSISSSDWTASVQLDTNKFVNYSCPNSLFDYLGLKPKYYNNNAEKPSYLPYLQNTTDSFSTTGYGCVSKFNALIPFAYQKICRFNYMPSNLLQDNHVWFPEDLEDPWYIDYSASNLDGCYFVPESATMPEDDFIANFVPSADSSSGDNVVDLRQLRYALFGDDYFTTAKPWLVRGSEIEADSAAKLSVNNLVSLLSIRPSVDSSSDLFGSYSGTPISSSQLYGNVYEVAPEPLGAKKATVVSNDGGAQPTDALLNSSLSTIISKFISESAIRTSSSEMRLPLALTANTLRNLLALSVWQERNTLTDGNYNRTIMVHWNHKPKSPEYEPLYIGGTTDLVSFGQVIQQSSTVSGSPLGSKAGSGSASGGSDVFNFTADDYGIIMGVMIISPEVVYSQGVGHEWTDLTFDQQFQPEFANLGYQPILNQELYAQGNSDDDDLFGYQTRYAYLKQRDNTVSGLFDLSSSQDSVFGPFVQARRFNSLPELSAQFVTMSPDNIDRSFLSFPNYPAFKLQFASDVSLIRSLPYQSTPETFGF